MVQISKLFSRKPPLPDNLAGIKQKLASLWWKDKRYQIFGASKNGYIPICNQGCSYLAALVLTGDLAGSVLDGWCEGGSAVWRPAKRPPGLVKKIIEQQGHPILPPLPKPPTFIEWYLGWIEVCAADLGKNPRNRANSNSSRH